MQSVLRGAKKHVLGTQYLPPASAKYARAKRTTKKKNLGENRWEIKYSQAAEPLRSQSNQERAATRFHPFFFSVFLQLQVADFSDTHRTSEKKQVKQQQKESNFVGRYPFRAWSSPQTQSRSVCSSACFVYLVIYCLDIFLLLPLGRRLAVCRVYTTCLRSWQSRTNNKWTWMRSNSKPVNKKVRWKEPQALNGTSTPPTAR